MACSVHIVRVQSEDEKMMTEKSARDQEGKYLPRTFVPN